MATFRVHFTDGNKIDIDAETPAQATGAALKTRPGTFVAKVKLVKEAA